MGHDLEDFFYLIEATLGSANIEIIKATPIILPDFIAKTGELGDTYGYILELNGDGRAVLDEYAVEDDSDNTANKD
jgi:hypothetical protein